MIAQSIIEEDFLKNCLNSGTKPGIALLSSPLHSRPKGI